MRVCASHPSEIRFDSIVDSGLTSHAVVVNKRGLSKHVYYQLVLGTYDSCACVIHHGEAVGIHSECGH